MPGLLPGFINNHPFGPLCGQSLEPRLQAGWARSAGANPGFKSLEVAPRQVGVCSPALSACTATRAAGLTVELSRTVP